jgi:hypothetical protein
MVLRASKLFIDAMKDRSCQWTILKTIAASYDSSDPFLRAHLANYNVQQKERTIAFRPIPGKCRRNIVIECNREHEICAYIHTSESL